MTLQNATHWDTRSLRAIIARVAAEELNDTPRQREQRRRLRVRIVYTRQAWGLSGCAYVKGTHATLCLHKHVVAIDPVEFAWLCAHEFAHTRGMQHPQMPAWLMHFRDSSRERYAWAAAFPIVRKAERPAPSPEAQLDAKLANIRKRLALAETRVKRATTILKKWQRRERALIGRLTLAAGRAVPR